MLGPYELEKSLFELVEEKCWQRERGDDVMDAGGDEKVSEEDTGG